MENLRFDNAKLQNYTQGWERYANIADSTHSIIKKLERFPSILGKVRGTSFSTVYETNSKKIFPITLGSSSGAGAITSNSWN